MAPPSPAPSATARTPAPVSDLPASLVPAMGATSTPASPAAQIWANIKNFNISQLNLPPALSSLATRQIAGFDAWKIVAVLLMFLCLVLTAWALSGSKNAPANKAVRWVAVNMSKMG